MKENIRMRQYLLLVAIIAAVACNQELTNTGASSEVVAVSQTTPSPTNSRSHRDLVAKENSLYSFLLTKLVYGNGVYSTPEGLIVIQKQTHFEEEALKGLKDRVDSSLLVDFRNRNADVRELGNNFDVYFAYAIAPSSSTVPTDLSFSTKYPRALGILSLSRIAFSDEFNQGLVFTKFIGKDGRVHKSFWIISFRESEILETKEFPL